MPWTPLTRRDTQPDFQHNPLMPPELRGDEVWTSPRYQCIVRYCKALDPELPEGREGMLHLSIHTHDRGPMRNWRHLQQIKNEVAGEERTAVEIFPPESRLTDTANEYHLWVYPEGFDLGFGLSEKDSIVTDDETAEAFNAEPHKGQQEPWEEGLTTGRSEQSAEARQRMRRQYEEGRAGLP
jgi:hypothetical protein